MDIQMPNAKIQCTPKKANGTSAGNRNQKHTGTQAVFDRLKGWEALQVPALKPVVSSDSLHHQRLTQGEFWKVIPAYKGIDTETFLDHKWQSKNSVISLKRLRATLQDLMDESFYQRVQEGLRLAPMSLRVSPYLIALMDWSAPESCPLRIQFIPMGGKTYTDHPRLELDSLHEQNHSPVPGLTHRYRDKALFLPLDKCPVYCRFCTRSYSIGLDTEQVEKVSFRVNYERWKQAFAYIASRPELEDIVISGGDAYNLKPEQLEGIGMTLLNMSNIRRIRFATKGIAIMPQKILSHPEWVDALARVAEHGRKLYKEVAVHTHFNHPNEISWISQKAMEQLHSRGIIVRNQSVLQRGVNDSIEAMTTLVKRLSYINIQPYYVYVCDMVKGIEELRTSISTALLIEKHVRGSTAGFNTPTFVCDAPGGGGKRSIHSFEHYNPKTGIAVYQAPSVRAGAYFLYFDPLHTLEEDIQQRWLDESTQQEMIQEALAAAKHKSAA